MHRTFVRRGVAFAALLVSVAGSAAAQQIFSTSGAVIQDAAFGQTLLAAGDVDGDGYADYIAMSQATSSLPFYWPIAHVVSGKTGVKLHTIHPPIVIPPASGTDGEGLVVVPAGDLDGDGGVDIAVMRAGSAALTPLAYVISGKTGATLLDMSGTSGVAIARADDFDGDGADDVIVFVPPATTYVASASGAPIAAIPSTGLSLGDLNGDGRSEIAISDGAGGTNMITGPIGALLYTLPNVVVLGTCGDYDRDGFVDFDSHDGAVTLIFSGHDGHELVSFVGPTGGTRIGDVDLDGAPDYVVSPYSPDVDAIVSATGALVMTLPPLPLEPPGMRHPKRYAGIGDANGDGVPDLVVADLQGNNGFGAAYAVSLAPISTSAYGAGTPGCLGAHHLVADAAPKVGAGAFGFRADGAPPLGSGVLAISSAQAPPGYLGFLGIEAFVDFGAAEVHVFAMSADAFGFAAASSPLPNVPALAGHAYEAQAFFLWGMCVPSPFGLSTSQGVHFVVVP